MEKNVRIITSIDICYHCRVSDKMYRIEKDTVISVPLHVVRYLAENYRSNLIICADDKVAEIATQFERTQTRKEYQISDESI